MRKLMVVAGLVFALLLAGCDEDAKDREKQAQGQNYSGLQAKQPAEGMAYSPTREGLNRWMRTWEEQGKLSYVYLLGANGEEIGYYIFEGLPVSYCASLTPPEDISDWNSAAPVTTAPSMDGVYYSGSQCIQFFGYDAVSGAYLEFSAGGAFNFLLSDQPMTQFDTRPLGDATIDNVKDGG